MALTGWDRKINWVATNVNDFRRKKWRTLRRKAMRWKITIEGLDEFSGRDTAEMVIEKPFNWLSEVNSVSRFRMASRSWCYCSSLW